MTREIPTGFSPERILVIQLRQIGDVLLTTPSLRALKKRFAGARLSFLAEPIPAQVLAGNQNLDEVIIRDPQGGLLEPIRTLAAVRSRRFDLVIDFLANPRTTLISRLSGARVRISYAGKRRSFLYTHPVAAAGVFAAEQKLSLLRMLGCGPESPDLDMAVPDSARNKIREWMAAAGLEPDRDRPLVCLEPFSKWPVLTYPAAHHQRLAELMVEKWGARVIVCWGPGKHESARDLVAAAKAHLFLAPRTNLHELAALYACADLWVGNDSGARHVAASQQLPTFAVFGPTDDAWTPPGPRHLSVTHDDMPCRPCNQRVCPEGHHHCLALLPPERVFERLEEFRRLQNQLDGTDRGASGAEP